MLKSCSKRGALEDSIQKILDYLLRKHEDFTWAEWQYLGIAPKIMDEHEVAATMDKVILGIGQCGISVQCLKIYLELETILSLKLNGWTWTGSCKNQYWCVWTHQQRRRQTRVSSKAAPFLDIRINWNTADETGTNESGTNEPNAEVHADEKKKAAQTQQPSWYESCHHFAKCWCTVFFE